MDATARRVPAPLAALIAFAGLASAMGIGRFAFTPLLPLMQQGSGMTLAQGGSLAAANYAGYLVGALACTVLAPAPQVAARAGLVAVAALTVGMGLSHAYEIWLVLRFAAGAASAFVLVGVSAWVLPLLAAQGRASWSGWVYAGVGAGIFFAGIVGLATAVRMEPPAHAWLLLGACSALVALAVWRPMTAPTSSAPRSGGAREALGAVGWRLVPCYGAFGFGYIVPATFLPAAARQLVPDPVVFGWIWPVFGLAAAASTAAASRWWRETPPRRLWASAQLVMAIGVLAPAIRTGVSTLLLSAVCVGGTFMVVTMAGMQEARRVGGAAAPRLMAAMTGAFAFGQLVGPLTVTFARSPDAGAMALPHGLAAAALVLGTLALREPRRAAAPHALTATKGDPR
jgi:MFS family permease